MVSQHKLSERHACALVGLSRDSYRHPVIASALNQELKQKIVQTAHERRRWGYRTTCNRLHAIQFSSFKPLTRPKSFTLLVTTVASRLRAWAAIIKSFAPIIWPFFLRSARISA